MRFWKAFSVKHGRGSYSDWTGRRAILITVSLHFHFVACRECSDFGLHILFPWIPKGSHCASIYLASRSDGHSIQPTNHPSAGQPGYPAILGHHHQGGLIIVFVANHQQPPAENWDSEEGQCTKQNINYNMNHIINWRTAIWSGRSLRWTQTAVLEQSLLYWGWKEGRRMECHLHNF